MSQALLVLISAQPLISYVSHGMLPPSMHLICVLKILLPLRVAVKSK